MSCEQATAQALRESGHRLTPQRLMILSVIRHSDMHVTASEIYDQVKESYPFHGRLHRISHSGRPQADAPRFGNGHG